MNILTLEDGKILIGLARHAIDTYLSGKSILYPEADKFTGLAGVFVTLNALEKLRGCIGFVEGTYPLKRGIIEAARAAAFKDPRFPPITKTELEEITIEVSILSEPKLLQAERPEQYLDMIKIGKDGLIVKKEYHAGLLLPQVFIAEESTPKEALEMTCQKAGIDPTDWEEKDAQVFVFHAQVFSEEEPEGKVIEEI